MKYLALIPLVLVASCASRPQLVVRPSSPPAVEPVEAVRYGEVVRAYHIGRYVDRTTRRRCTNNTPSIGSKFPRVGICIWPAEHGQSAESAARCRVCSAAHQRCADR